VGLMEAFSYQILGLLPSQPEKPLERQKERENNGACLHRRDPQWSSSCSPPPSPCSSSTAMMWACVSNLMVLWVGLLVVISDGDGFVEMVFLRWRWRWV
jgi:hypothetical protein